MCACVAKLVSVPGPSISIASGSAEEGGRLRVQHHCYEVWMAF
jgi:hypothetical protein